MDPLSKIITINYVNLFGNVKDSIEMMKTIYGLLAVN